GPLRPDAHRPGLDRGYGDPHFRSLFQKIPGQVGVVWELPICWVFRPMRKPPRRTADLLQAVPPLRDLHSYRLFTAYRHWRQPVEPVGFFAADNRVELLLDRLGNRSDDAFAHADLIHRTDGGDFRCGATEEDFVSNIEQFARNALLDGGNPKFTGDPHHRVSRNTGQHRIP